LLIISIKNFQKLSKIKSAPAQCPVDFAFQRIGGKYKGRVLWFLKDGIKRYGEMRRFITGITPKMLTQVLRELEDDQLITRTVYFEVPPRVEYCLTESGRALVPSIQLISKWGQEQMKQQGIGATQEDEEDA
jgi:DNA-binding HxlR family transcriptional regulator